MILLWFAVCWIGCSIMMTFFSPVLDKFRVTDENILTSIIVAPIALPFWFIALLFWAALALGEYVFE